MNQATHAVDKVAIASLEPGTALLVSTRNSHYRLTVLDSTSNEVLVEGGRLFHDATPARLEGATAGGSALKAGWVGVGLRMEMSIAGRRITTSPVQSIEVEHDVTSEPIGVGAGDANDQNFVLTA